MLLGVKGVMIARGAQSNVSVFRKEGLVSHLEIVRQYIRKVQSWILKKEKAGTRWL